MPLLDNTCPTRFFYKGSGSQPHNTFPDFENAGTFQHEQQQNPSIVFDSKTDRQAMCDADLAALSQKQAPARSATVPNTFEQDFGSLGKTVDPTDLWSDTSATGGDVGNEPASASETIQERTPAASRSSARNTANRRRSKGKAARKDSHHDDEDNASEAGSASLPATDSKTQCFREKNKLASAKCRSRQRKQVQILESKCNHLSAANGELKRQVRDLAGELNGLRAYALQHQGCNCPVAGYNLNQARRVAADLQAFGTTGVEVQQRQQLRRQSELEVRASVAGERER